MTAASLRLWTDVPACPQRHKFTVPFALENARDLLVWRLAVIPDEIPRPTAPFLQCLPLTARDPFNRPIVVVKLSSLFQTAEDARTTLIYYMEMLRLNLEGINEASSDDEQPVLQYVAMVDIGGLSVQSVVGRYHVNHILRSYSAPCNVQQNVDIIGWFIYELVPRFPGMLAAGNETIHIEFPPNTDVLLGSLHPQLFLGTFRGVEHSQVWLYPSFLTSVLS